MSGQALVQPATLESSQGTKRNSCQSAQPHPLDSIEVLCDTSGAKAGTSMQGGAFSSKGEKCSFEGIDFNKMGPDLKYLCDVIIERGPDLQFFIVHTPSDLFHHEKRFFMIHKDDIHKLLTNHELNVLIIQLYMFKVNEATLKNCKEDTTTYIANALKAQHEKKLIIFPFFQRAFLEFYYRGGSSQGGSMSFKQFKCPEQPDKWKCSYYVMNFMRDLIMSEHINVFPNVKDVFPDKYTGRDIVNIRRDWGSFF